MADCSWRASWTISAGVANYTLKNTQNQSYTIIPVTSNGGTTPIVQVTGNTIAVTLSCPQAVHKATSQAQSGPATLTGAALMASF